MNVGTFYNRNVFFDFKSFVYVCGGQSLTDGDSNASCTND